MFQILSLYERLLKTRCMKPFVLAGCFLLERHRSIFFLRSSSLVWKQLENEVKETESKVFSGHDLGPHKRSNWNQTFQDPQIFVKMFSLRNSNDSEVAYGICKVLPSVGLPLLFLSFQHRCIQVRLPNDDFELPHFFWENRKLDVLLEVTTLIYP